MRQPEDAAQQANAGVSASVEIWQLKQGENLEQFRVFLENRLKAIFLAISALLTYMD